MAAEADTKPTADAGPPAVVMDPQDALPESDWFWRRVFVYLVLLLATVSAGVVLYMLYTLGATTLELVAKLAGPRDVRALDQALETVGQVVHALYRLGFWSLILIMLMVTLYLIAPSAEQFGKWMATVSAWKGGISTTSTTRSVSPDGGTAEATTSAGPAAPTPAPARPAAPAPPVVDLSNE